MVIIIVIIIIIITIFLIIIISIINNIFNQGSRGFNSIYWMNHQPCLLSMLGSEMFRMMIQQKMVTAMMAMMKMSLIPQPCIHHLVGTLRIKQPVTSAH